MARSAKASKAKGRRLQNYVRDMIDEVILNAMNDVV